jgi:hypothetical protein
MEFLELKLIDSKGLRLPLNGNILKHLEDLITNQVLLPVYEKKFENWRYSIAISVNEVSWNKPFVPPTRQIKAEKTKYTNMMIPIRMIEPGCSIASLRSIIGVVFEGLKDFICENFKKIEIDQLNNLFDNIDFNELWEMFNSEDLFSSKIYFKE